MGSVTLPKGLEPPPSDLILKETADILGIEIENVPFLDAAILIRELARRVIELEKRK